MSAHNLSRGERLEYAAAMIRFSACVPVHCISVNDILTIFRSITNLIFILDSRCARLECQLRSLAIWSIKIEIGGCCRPICRA